MFHGETMGEITLLKNGIIVTMDPSMGILENGHLVIRENKIEYVGKSYDDALKVGKPDIEIDLTKKAVMPGLVNIHSHVYQILLKDIISDVPYAIWDNKYVFPIAKYINKEIMKYATYLATIEMLESGTTTVADTHYFHTEWDCIEGIAEAFKDIGIRGVLAWGIIDYNSPEYIIKDPDESLKRFKTFRENWNKPEERIRVDIAPVGFGMTTEETLVKASELAKELDLWIHIHSAGTQASNDSVMWKKFVSETEYYNQLGLIGPKTIVAHAVWVDKTDIKTLAEKKASVAHNPMSNMNLSFGIAPVVDMLEMGVNVGLGTDGLGSYTQDMFNVIRTTLLLHKLNKGASAITAKTALEMATINGAKALGLQNEIGSISPGKRADLVIIDLNHANTVPYRNMYPILANSISPKNIDMVFVNGKMVVKDGKVTTVNREEILEKGREIAQSLWEKCGFM